MNYVAVRRRFHELARMGLLVAMGLSLSTMAAAQDPSRGGVVYEENCSFCHGTNGEGIPDAIPPLVGNPAVGEAARVEAAIRNGQETDAWPEVMPPFSDLPDADIAAVVLFVQTELGHAAPSREAEVSEDAAEPVLLDAAAAARGQALFTGQQMTENGGPSCVACHGAGALGRRGRTLGVDLTDLFTRLETAERVMAMLRNPPSPVMRPVYANAPLTDEERRDLTAFFAEVAKETDAAGLDGLLIAGVVGAVALFGVMALVMTRPRESYAHRLRNKT